MTKIEHILAHTYTVVLVHRLKDSVAGSFPSLGDPSVWIDAPAHSVGPIEAQPSSTAADGASVPADNVLETPHEQDAPLPLTVNGYEDIDLGVLSDLRLTPPANEHASRRLTVEMPIRPVDMDEPMFETFMYFMEHQGS
jgi:hypothetical protein